MNLVLNIAFWVLFWIAVYVTAKAAAMSVFEKGIAGFKEFNDANWAKALGQTLEFAEKARKAYVDQEVAKVSEKTNQVGDNTRICFERVQQDVAYLDESLGDCQDQIIDLQDFLDVDYETTPETTKLVKVGKKK